MIKPRVSIIIPFRRMNEFVRVNIRACLASSYRPFEILLIPDRREGMRAVKNCRIVESGAVGPAIKRDLGAKVAKGEILAFIDDDVYPTSYWLEAIVSGLKDKEVAAVGGPGVTPPGVSWQEAVSGWFSASPIGGGGFSYRFLPKTRRYVDDYPSMNLAVRKKDFWAVGGFDSAYWPGEDTKLCLDLVHKLGKKILYEPTALVYHHRRPIWTAHLRQYGNFGIHRGYFARVLPRTSARIIYFLPSMLCLTTLALLGGVSISRKYPAIVTVSIMLSYLLITIINGVWIMKNSQSLRFGLISIPVTIMSHYWYGIRFIQGFLFTRKLVS